MLAQEIQIVLPEAVYRGEDGFLNVKYGELSPLLISAIHDLKAANDNLVSKTTSLETQLRAANDNYLELRREMDGLKRAVGR